MAEASRLVFHVPQPLPRAREAFLMDAPLPLQKRLQRREWKYRPTVPSLVDSSWELETKKDQIPAILVSRPAALGKKIFQKIRIRVEIHRCFQLRDGTGTSPDS